MLVQTVDNPADYDAPPVALEMRAGQISQYSDWILHGSGPNRSNRRRCGLAMRYLSADVRSYNGWNSNSIWCRGADPGGHWANHPHPDGEVIPRHVLSPLAQILRNTTVLRFWYEHDDHYPTQR